MTGYKRKALKRKKPINPPKINFPQTLEMIWMKIKPRMYNLWMDGVLILNETKDGALVSKLYLSL
jgi:hypothetical protein